MSSATSSNRELLRPVLKKLISMRGKLTRWILVHGLGRWLMVVLGILALDMLLDRVFKMDFAQRLVMLVVMAVAIAGYFIWRVIKPLLARPNDDALLYEVENKNPELKENLLTGVQLSREQNFAATGASPELAQLTINRGIEQAKAIDFSGVLDLSRHLQNWILMLVGLGVLVSIGVGIQRTDFLKTWFNRNVLLLNDRWPQSTYLEIVGVEDGKLTIPRGTDHRQIVNILPNSTVTDVEVSLEIENPGGRTIHPMKPTGKNDGLEHVFVLHNVSSALRFRATGGDEVTPWIDVELVEPPNIIKLDLQALLPKYTGIESLALAGNGPHSVLAGSRLQANIETNKPLTSAILKRGEQEFPMMQLENAQQFGVTIPTDGQGDLIGGEYEIELLDTEGVSSSRKSKFKIAIKNDSPPKVRANLLGLSGLVSARAMLPVEYNTTDDFGLVQLAFDANWKSGTDDQAGKRYLVFADLDLDEQGNSIRKQKDVSVLDLLPLKLSIGTRFRFTIAASDNHPNPQQTGNSQEFSLKIVSDEELRADLLRREIEQRKAFDQAYQQQLELQTELQAIAAQVKPDNMSAENFDDQRESNFVNLVRTQKGIGSKIDSVANRFEQLLVEVKNNRLDEAENEIAPEQRIETRFLEQIVEPIRRIDQELITLASQHLDNCRRTFRDPQELQPAVDRAVDVQQQILEEMKIVLSAMNDSESFQEIINDVLKLKLTESEMLKAIRQRLKPKDDDDVFEN